MSKKRLCTEIFTRRVVDSCANAFPQPFSNPLFKYVESTFVGLPLYIGAKRRSLPKLNVLFLPKVPWSTQPSQINLLRCSSFQYLTPYTRNATLSAHFPSRSHLTNPSALYRSFATHSLENSGSELSHSILNLQVASSEKSIKVNDALDELANVIEDMSIKGALEMSHSIQALDAVKNVWVTFKQPSSAPVKLQGLPVSSLEENGPKRTALKSIDLGHKKQALTASEASAQGCAEDFLLQSLNAYKKVPDRLQTSDEVLAPETISSTSKRSDNVSDSGKKTKSATSKQGDGMTLMKVEAALSARLSRILLSCKPTFQSASLEDINSCLSSLIACRRVWIYSIPKEVIGLVEVVASRLEVCLGLAATTESNLKPQPLPELEVLLGLQQSWKNLRVSQPVLGDRYPAIMAALTNAATAHPQASPSQVCAMLRGVADFIAGQEQSVETRQQLEARVASKPAAELSAGSPNAAEQADKLLFQRSDSKKARKQKGENVTPVADDAIRKQDNAPVVAGGNITKDASTNIKRNDAPLAAEGHISNEAPMISKQDQAAISMDALVMPLMSLSRASSSSLINIHNLLTSPSVLTPLDAASMAWSFACLRVYDANAFERLCACVSDRLPELPVSALKELMLGLVEVGHPDTAILCRLGREVAARSREGECDAALVSSALWSLAVHIARTEPSPELINACYELVREVNKHRDFCHPDHLIRLGQADLLLYDMGLDMGLDVWLRGEAGQALVKEAYTPTALTLGAARALLGLGFEAQAGGRTGDGMLVADVLVRGAPPEIEEDRLGPNVGLILQGVRDTLRVPAGRPTARAAIRSALLASHVGVLVEIPHATCQYWSQSDPAVLRDQLSRLMDTVYRGAWRASVGKQLHDDGSGEAYPLEERDASMTVQTISAEELGYLDTTSAVGQSLASGSDIVGIGTEVQSTSKEFFMSSGSSPELNLRTHVPLDWSGESEPRFPTTASSVSSQSVEYETRHMTGSLAQSTSDYVSQPPFQVLPLPSHSTEQDFAQRVSNAFSQSMSDDHLSEGEISVKGTKKPVVSAATYEFLRQLKRRETRDNPPKWSPPKMPWQTKYIYNRYPSRPAAFPMKSVHCKQHLQNLVDMISEVSSKRTPAVDTGARSKVGSVEEAMAAIQEAISSGEYNAEQGSEASISEESLQSAPCDSGLEETSERSQSQDVLVSGWDSPRLVGSTNDETSRGHSAFSTSEAQSSNDCSEGVVEAIAPVEKKMSGKFLQGTRYRVGRTGSHVIKLKVVDQPANYSAAGS